MRDLIVEKGPTRDITSNLDFQKDENSQHFSIIHYIRKLLNWERHERTWLVYWKKLDKVFCFCCKLLSNSHFSSQLVDDGCNNWKNLSARLKQHETFDEYITNMIVWIELEVWLQKEKNNW